jgi:hypothetical protein
LYKVANEDRVLVKLKEVVLRGFPQSSYDIDEELKQFHKFKHDLHVAEELVCYKDRIIIPVNLRSQGVFDAKALVRSREIFTNFNISEEIATDGGPQMMSDIFQKSLKAWGIRHRLSSAYNPHSNCRAELAVKVGKKLLRDNMGHGGSLDTDKFMRAVLQYHNTSMQHCRRTPTQMVFGRQMRDFIPSLTYKHEPAKDWAQGEDPGQQERDGQSEVEPQVGTAVAIQNQTGTKPDQVGQDGHCPREQAQLQGDDQG